MAILKDVFFCGIIFQLLLAQFLVLGLGIRAADPSLEDVYIKSVSKELNHFGAIPEFFWDWAPETLTGGA